jgi:hypothetical protein
MKQALRRMIVPAPDARLTTALKDTGTLWLFCTVPTIALVGCFKWLAPSLFPSSVDRASYFLSAPKLVGSVTWGPALETVFLGALILFLRKVVGTDRSMSIILLSAAICAAIHSLDWIGWGLFVFWPFVIFAVAFARWEPRGLVPAFFVAFAVHALHNGTALLVTAIAIYL